MIRANMTSPPLMSSATESGRRKNNMGLLFHHWSESRDFPVANCNWVRDLGKIPYVRLMLRSDVDQKHSEKTSRLKKIIAGDFDDDFGLGTWRKKLWIADS